jgi:hypothetical protein
VETDHDLQPEFRTRTEKLKNKITKKKKEISWFALQIYDAIAMYSKNLNFTTDEI